MQFIRPVIFFVFTGFLASCGTQKKTAVNYIDNTDSARLNDTVKITEIKIQKNDLLSVQVYSASLDPAVDAPFNLGASAGSNSTTGGASSGSSGGSSAAGAGFLVDENGNIEYPRLGTIHAEGLTKSELAAIIKTRLTSPIKLLENPSVIIRFLNFKVTVLGEVGRAGPINIPTGHVTVLEAIGLAGDIPLTGKKNTVRILREIDGKREIGYIDLTSKKIFDSPYYNLLQNDVVIVEVSRTKLRQSDQVTLQRITTVLGIITSLTLIYNILK